MYKIIVYAITKNEEKFVSRWYESMSEADEIYVLDTGSTDKTVELLSNLGVNVFQKEIKPWRFDVARNASLDLVPRDVDICICTDLDEVFIPGWRKKLEKIWQKDTTRLRYVYNWSLDENNNPIINFYGEKIHCRNGFTWTHPVHEVLKYKGQEKYLFTDDITINHYPDKSKSRSSYLPLLELSVKEDPLDDRNMHYLGREYMFYGKYNEAIDTLEKHLSLKSATWKDERCASMRFISRCYWYLKRYEEAKMWTSLAIKEAPYLKEPYMEKAIIHYSLKEYQDAIKLIKKALKIKLENKTYIKEPFTKDTYIYDMLSICYYEVGEYKKALYYVKKLKKIVSNDIRINKNYDIMSMKVRDLNESKSRSFK